MSSDKGYIKIYRDIWDHWIWKSNRPFDEFHAWVDLIMMANHKDEKKLFDGKMIIIKRGTKVTSIRKLASRWGWGRNHVSDFLNMLEKDGMITQSRASKKTTLSVCNYSIYQGSNRKLGATDGATDGATGEATDGAADGAQTIKYKNAIRKLEEETIPSPGENADPKHPGKTQDELDEEEGWYLP